MPRFTGLLVTIALRTARGRRIKEGLTVYYDPTNPTSYPGVGTTVYDLSGYGIHSNISSMGWDGFRGYFTNTSFLVSPPVRTWVIPAVWASFTNISGPRGVALAKSNYSNGLSFSIWYKMDGLSPGVTNSRLIFLNSSFELRSTLNLISGVQTFTCIFRYEVKRRGEFSSIGVAGKAMTLTATRYGIYQNTWSNIAFGYSTTSKTGILYVNAVPMAVGVAVPDSAFPNYHCPPWIDLSLIRVGFSSSIFGTAYSSAKFGKLRIYRRGVESATVLAIYDSEKNTYLGNPTTPYELITDGLVFNLGGNFLTDAVTQKTGIIVGTGVNYIDSNGGYTYFAERTPGRNPPLDCIRYFDHIPSGALGGEFTIHFWVRDPPKINGGLWSGADKSYSILKFIGPNSRSPGLWLYKSPTTNAFVGYDLRRRFILQIGQTICSLYGANFGSNIWYAVTIIYRPGQGISYYLNGEETFNQVIAPSVPAASIDSSKPLLIGRSDSSFLDNGVASNNDSYTTGREFSLGRVYMYNRALSDSEVWTTYNVDLANYTT